MPVERVTLARDLLGAGYAEQALAEVNAALWGNPELAVAHLLKGLLLIGRDDVAGAARCLDCAVRLDPDLREAWLWLARVWQELGQSPEALTAAQQAVRLSAAQRDRKAEAQGHAARGAALSAMGCPRESMAAYRAAVACDPFESHARRELGRLLMDMGRESEASDAMDEAERLDPLDAEAKLLRGKLLAERGDLEAAMRALEDAARLAPRKAEPLEKIAELLVRQGHYQEALRFLTEATRREPKHAESYLQMGRIYVKLRRAAEAAEMFRTARLHDASLPDVERLVAEASGTACPRAARDRRNSATPAEPSDP